MFSVLNLWMHGSEIRYTPWGKAQNISRLSDISNVLQECTPVGCVPSAAVAISPATLAPPTMHAPTMHNPLPCMPPATHTPPPSCMPPATHTSLPCMPPYTTHPLWTEFLTHACGNITFPQLLLWTVIMTCMRVFLDISRCLKKQYLTYKFIVWLVESHLSGCFWISCPQVFEKVRGIIKWMISLSVVWVVNTLIGGGNTRTLNAVINFIWTFCTLSQWGCQNIALAPSCTRARAI